MIQTQHTIAGYTIITSEHTRTVWDGDDLLVTLDGEATDQEIEMWIAGYNAGHSAGQVVGRRTLQWELRRL